MTFRIFRATVAIATVLGLAGCSTDVSDATTAPQSSPSATTPGSAAPSDGATPTMTSCSASELSSKADNGWRILLPDAEGRIYWSYPTPPTEQFLGYGTLRYDNDPDHAVGKAMRAFLADPANLAGYGLSWALASKQGSINDDDAPMWVDSLADAQADLADADCSVTLLGVDPMPVPDAPAIDCPASALVRFYGGRNMLVRADADGRIYRKYSDISGSLLIGGEDSYDGDGDDTNLESVFTEAWSQWLSDGSHTTDYGVDWVVTNGEGFTKSPYEAQRQLAGFGCTVTVTGSMPRANQP